MLPSHQVATSADGLPGSKADGPASRSLLRALRYLLPANQILALADQIVVSATSFLVFVAIARSTSPGELGSYALAVSVLAFCLSTQESLITRPYAIKLHEPVGRPGQHAFGVLVLSLGLCGALALAASATAFTVIALGARPELIRLMWSVTAALPFVLMREFARRFAFAHLAVSQALVLDLAVALLTLVAAALLYWTGTMSAAAMLAATGASCALAMPIWLYAVRRQFSVGLQSLGWVLRQCWDLGKWFLSGQLGLQAQNYLTPWLALVISGAAVAGLYAACASIVAFTNPVIFGFYNILTPKFVRIFHQDGIAALRRRAISDTLFLSGIMAAFCLVVFAFGGDIMRLLYRDEIYAGNSNVLVLLALAALAATTGVPAALALSATGRARPVAAVTLLTALFNISLIALLLPWLGLWGAAFAILAGEILGAIARWATFWLLAPLADISAGSREPSNAWPSQA